MSKYILIHQDGTKHTDTYRDFVVRVPDDFKESRIGKDEKLMAFLDRNAPEWGEDENDEGEIETCITDVHGEITVDEADALEVIDLTEYEKAGVVLPQTNA